VDEDAELADRFEAQRARLRAVAYHMLGSPGEADDAVQEAWLRLSRSDSGNIENLGGWLTTVVARVCLDMLRPRREEPSGLDLALGLHVSPSRHGVDANDGREPALAAAVTRLPVASASPFVLVAQLMITPAPRTAASMPSPRRRSPLKNMTWGSVSRWRRASTCTLAGIDQPGNDRASQAAGAARDENWRCHGSSPYLQAGP